MRERVIEQYLCQQVGKTGGIAIKLTSSNNRGLPDRLCLFPGVVVFVELKAPGKHPAKLQKVWLGLIKALGHKAVVIDSRPKVDALVLWYERFVSKSGVDKDQARKLMTMIRS